MPFQPQRAALALTDMEIADLRRISNSRTEKQANVLRARIIIAYHDRQSISAIARDLKVSRPLVERCVDKALGGGVEVALADLPRTGRPAIITAEAKAWVTNLACSKPAEHGYAAELWTFNQLSN